MVFGRVLGSDRGLCVETVCWRFELPEETQNRTTKGSGGKRLDSIKLLEVMYVHGHDCVRGDRHEGGETG